MSAPAPLHVAVRRLDAPTLAGLGHTTRTAVAAVARHAVVRGAPSFWLDSARSDATLARWSILGDAVDVLGEDGAGETDSPGPRLLFLAEPSDPDAAWSVLADALAPRAVRGEEGLPLRGGYVGFLGYELGLADLGVTPSIAGARDPVPLPALFFLRPTRYVVADHAAEALTCCVVALDPTAGERAVDEWEAAVRDALRLPRPSAPNTPAGPPSSPASAAAPGTEVPGTWREDRVAYAALIERCHGALRDGDSYELCLTTRFDVDAEVDVDPLDLFEDLVAHHPTPYAALIERGVREDEDGWAVVSASPERFLSGRDRRYSTKPIKGTAPRHADPEDDARAARELAADPKTRAENLMIVDLLRNDLTRVCIPGSVHVPSLMAVESYASVHQLVSTVTGVARPGLSAVDVARSLFPGGSMTGAPKRRSVELLAAWEAAPRGVYSGALGLFSADGACELSIVIRTAVRSAGRWSIGAGGAIVADSEADAEYDEVMLKASGLRRAFARVDVRHSEASPVVSAPVPTLEP